MATNWPTSRDTFTNPSSGDSLASPSHAAQHANINDAVEAMQAHAGLVRIMTVDVSPTNTYTIDGIFTSQFLNYKIVVRGTSASSFSDFFMRYRIGGTTLATNYYQSIAFHAFTGASGYINGTAIAQHMVGAMGARSIAVIDISGPAEATQPTYITQAQVYGAGVVTSYEGGGVNDNASAKSGVSLFVNSGITWSGRVTVYGYNQ